MDGTIAKLDLICDLAKKYDSLVFVDDCHATGFIGSSGKGIERTYVIKNRYYYWNFAKH